MEGDYLNIEKLGGLLTNSRELPDMKDFNKKDLIAIIEYVYRFAETSRLTKENIDVFRSHFNNKKEDYLRRYILAVYQGEFIPDYIKDSSLHSQLTRNKNSMLKILISFAIGFIIGKRYNEIIASVKETIKPADLEKVKNDRQNNDFSGVILILKNTGQKTQIGTVSDIQQNTEYFENNLYSILITDNFSALNFNPIKNEEDKESKFVFFEITAGKGLGLEYRFSTKVRLLELTNFLKKQDHLKIDGPYFLSTEQFQNFSTEFHNKNKLY